MALRLAGEEFSVLQGLDALGWLREVEAKDSDPGLKVDQQGSGRLFDFQDGGASQLYMNDGGDVVCVPALDVRGVLKNTGSANGGAVAFDDEVRAADVVQAYDGGLATGATVGLLGSQRALRLYRRTSLLTLGDWSTLAGGIYLYASGVTRQLVIDFNDNGTLYRATIDLTAV